MQNETERKADKMSAEARAARNAYKRRWAKENRDKVAAAERRYWERRAKAAAEEG